MKCSTRKSHGIEELLHCATQVHNLDKKLFYEHNKYTFREERKLRVFEYMVLRRIFGPRRDKVTGEWRRLHNEELK